MIKKYFSSASTGLIKRLDGGEEFDLTQEEEAILANNRSKVFTPEYRGTYDFLIIVNFQTGAADIFEYTPNSKVATANRSLNIFESWE